MATICTVTFSKSDRIRVNGVAFPDDIILPIHKTIVNYWSPGIKKELIKRYGAYEFKLNGKPWAWYGSSKNGVETKKLLIELLLCMSKCGWCLIQSCDVTNKQMSKDTLFMDKAPVDPYIKLFAINFSLTDRIRIIDAPLPAIETIIQETIAKNWPLGVKDAKRYHGSLEIKLGGYPWFTHSAEESVAAKLMLCHLISVLKTVGYKLYASVNISPGGRHLDTWVFRKITMHWH